MEVSVIGFLHHHLHQLRLKQNMTWSCGNNKWESSLLQNVDVQYPIHQMIMELGQSNFIITTDGSPGTDSMSFSWKICTQQGKILEYGQDDNCLNFRLYLDDESVITRIHQQEDWPYDCPFNTLASGWDIIAQIVAVLNKSDLMKNSTMSKGIKIKTNNIMNCPCQLN
eukprot:13124854-Ditylum_brightwellii.AAC.1